MNYSYDLLKYRDSDFPAEIAERWDKLCAADGDHLPTARFAHLRLWFQTFAPQIPWRALIVTCGDRWVAAFPLVARRFLHWLPYLELPHSDWTPTPQILVDREFVEEPQLYATIVRGLRAAGRPLLQVRELQQRSSSARLVDALAAVGGRCDLKPRFEVGRLDIRGPQAAADWATYQKQLSGNFRRKIGKMLRRAESLGGVELLVQHPRSAEEIRRGLDEGFAIEDRSWKGEAGCSAVRTPGMVDFYRRQATLLAESDQLTLLFLKHRDQLIAFQYGFSDGRTYYSPKIGYDQAFAHLSPGHLLMHLWIEQLFAGDRYDTFDFAGPVSDSTSGWITSTYRVERLLAGTGWLGNGLLTCGQIARATRHWLQSRVQPVDSDGGESDQAEVLAARPGSGPPAAGDTNDDGRQRHPERRPSSPPILPSLDGSPLPADPTSVGR